MTDTKAVVLVADGQPLFAEALGRALADAGFEVPPEHPSRGTEALDAVGRHRPDVVVYDQWMLELDGPAAIRAIASLSPSTKVLVMSWFHGPHHIRAALEAGAVGFLPKSVGLREVVVALEQAAAGVPLVFGEELARLMETLDDSYQQSVQLCERAASLSPRELEVLEALVRPASIQEVAEQLSISTGTVRNHIHRILAKTGARSQMEALAMLRKAGLLAAGTLTRAARAGTGSSASCNGALWAFKTARATASSTRAVKVLVADTERLFADSLAHCLDREVDLAVLPVLPTLGTDAIEAVVRCRPDIVVYDLWLRRLKGPAAVRTLARWAPRTRVVLLASYHHRPDVRRAIALDPLAVVPKTATVEAVAQAVRAVAKRPVAEHAAAMGRLVEILDAGRGGENGAETLAQLSPRELQVLQAVAAGQDAKQMARELHLALGTVKNLMCQVLAKTGTRSHVEAVILADKAGFLE